jgi:hypothetical protein
MQPAPVTRPIVDRPTNLTEIPGRNEAFSAGVSWPAVVGGAFVAASLSLILLTLGTGLGLSVVSPSLSLSEAASRVGMGAIAWLIITQIIAFSFGGYVAGRLRTKWVQVHTDEVFFRDTANGLLVWAVGFVVAAVFLASTASNILARQRGEQQPVQTSEVATPLLNPTNYAIDTLFRGNGSVLDRSDAQGRNEAEAILAHALREGSMPAPDRTYLAKMVVARTGLSQTDAETRVSDVFTAVQQTADNTRKNLAHLSLWLFVALLCGAFCASYAGTIGGRQRDHVVAA